MCIFDDSLKRSMKNKDSTGGGEDVDGDNHGKSAVGVAPPSSMQLPTHSQSTREGEKDLANNDGLEKPAAAAASEIYGRDGHNKSIKHSNNTTKKAPDTVETILPNVVWLEHILPFLDRPAWNALMEASKPIYMLTIMSKLTAEYQGQRRSHPTSRSVAQPPWPTNRPFQSKSGGQGQAIESIAMSHDGEFLACGSVIGSIEIWNLRTGKIHWKTKSNLPSTSIVRSTIHDTTLYETAEEIAQCPNYFASSSPRGGASSSMQRRTTPLGSVLRFSQGGGYTLACGFENRVFVWDLEQELRQKQQQRSTFFASTNNHEQTISKDATPSLPLHKQHHIFVPLSRRKQSEEQERRRLQRQKECRDNSSLCYQTLEIECNQGTIYEVTYLGFSNTFGSCEGSKNKTPHRLVARYGKKAYIWTTSVNDENSARYILTHRVPLSSSRCQMVSNPSLTLLAVATNGGGSRRNNARQTDDASSTVSSKAPVEKGIIHVWNLKDSLVSKTKECRQPESVSEISSESSTKIVAYPDHVVRGLEFLPLGNTYASSTSTATNTTTSRSDDSSDSDGCLLVSASLQGEVKFWKKYKPAPKHPRDRYCSSNDTMATSHMVPNEQEEPSFVCVYQFQSPGKIFSLASWSSMSSLSDSGKILLAAGEARGQVRVWKVSPHSLLSPSSPFSKVSVGCCSKSRGDAPNDSTKQERLEECLSTEVGDHVHYDNIKLLSFTPNGKSLAVSRAYDSKIWFQTVWQ